MISEQLKKSLQQRVETAITPREAAVDVMKELQRHYGWLTDEAVGEAGELLGLSPLQVEELATFYEKIYRRPVTGKLIQVCDSISCWSGCCDGIIEHLKKRLDVELGGSSADGKFTLVPCCCLGRCGDAPVMVIGETFYGNLTPEKVDQILEKER
ncbi:NADH-quinone oxidoreductase subunit NuoE [Geomesophilobacter sediminis]|uniref:NADH-quinone oxidoreductase subunit NuoE n=1 Tax=Geomesophilobacter sediminis TaxID=2798584 RepID=A0A8J7JGA6_9BACT|nr:NADH-quinone oxidoreductase subunit NuoE [Geomesophilobacter sediminis]MBJ6725679.1 NADH-quinone oxidoreductase subunit NuoE [Geomesophilobacter sediminis]